MIGQDHFLDLGEGLAEACGVGDPDRELVEFMVGTLVFLVHHVGALELIKHRRDRYEDGVVLALKRVRTPGRAGAGFCRARGLGLFCPELPPAFVLFPFIEPKLAHHGKGAAIDEDGFTQRVEASAFRPKLSRHALADHTNPVRVFQVQFGQAPTALQFVFVHRNEVGPGADHRGTKDVVGAANGGTRDFRRGRDMRHKGAAARDGFRVAQGAAR